MFTPRFMLSAGYNTQTQTVTVTVTVTLTVNVNVTVTGMDGVLKTLHDDIANRKMPAKAHNFHLRVLVEVRVCVCVSCYFTLVWEKLYALCISLNRRGYWLTEDFNQERKYLKYNSTMEKYLNDFFPKIC